ncbi:hypothetical protein AwDysgo_20990 [Bacteroidales bacterium]|nr:hypothetical protein AwDysgo_20990 [Bacteroidales bacterium]
MPYRRLPNTDDARIRSLKTALLQAQLIGIHNLAFSLVNIQNAKVLLAAMERSQNNYKMCLKEQVEANKNYQNLIKQSKLYISHFVQVLNLSIIRGEIKLEHKTLYGLEIGSNSVPDLNTDVAILEWGEKLMRGETDRICKGGSPVYNPTIAKVRVHYEMFKNAHYNQKMYQQNTSRHLKSLVELRSKVDEIILIIWNEIEENFKNEDPKNKINKCKEYGIIYYYKKGER